MSPLGLAAFALACLLPLPAAAQIPCGDVNDSGDVTTSDALSVLRFAVGQPVNLVCEGECTAIESRVTALEADLAAAQAQLASIEALLEGLSRTDDALVLSGANFQVVDGTGATAGPVNGRGNIIVGYNEATLGQSRTGSHNLVVGIDNEYTSFGGIVAGERNTISARGACVLGGKQNSATGIHASVSGGSSNVASGPYASVGAGFDNLASGTNAAVSGGCENDATNTYSAVSGGQLGVAGAFWSSVTGGKQNEATGEHSSVSGGNSRIATGQYDWKAGTLVQDQ